MDNLLAERAELNRAQRATEWALADQAADFIRKFGRESLGKVAELDRSSRAMVSTSARVSVAFPKESRYPDIPLNYYQTVLRAANRIGKSPAVLLEEALEKNWSNKDLNNLGKKPKEVARLSATCDWCGARVRVEHPNQGIKVLCPVCHEQGRESALGLLE